MSVRLCVLLVALIFVGAAQAGNASHPVFDAVASEVAGKPVAVWCETSWNDWVNGTEALGMTHAPGGFTWISTPVVYLSPEACRTLWALLSRESVGTFPAALALQVLAHEAVHQRGIVDEGETDCLALPLVPSIAVRHFGVPETVSESYAVSTSRMVTIARYVRVSKTKRVRVTKRVKVTSSSVAVREIPNPWLARLVADGLRWHRTLPAEYQGTC